ncbi:MAG: toll/interleukin-1 receptor domain-containing protein [Paracoccaceae bacterium]
MRFDWQLANEHLAMRYPDNVRGYGAWQEFVKTILDLSPDKSAKDLPALHDNMLELFNGVPPAQGGSALPTVFVSHQRADAGSAERIAWLACESGLDYWLDIHDPVLSLATNTIPLSDPRYPLIVAAIIEMALLNSSYLIAVHTSTSLASRWVPYEFGRARDRNIRSQNCGGWFCPATTIGLHGDYVRLAQVTQGGEHLLNSWLAAWSNGRPPLSWSLPSQPAPLP